MNDLRPDLEARRRNRRLGLVLFSVYLLLYCSYVMANALGADVMRVRLLGGVNVAVLSGFGLIITAVVLALLYGRLCVTSGSSGGDDGDGA